ncbi:MAG: hypothetical protein V4606_03505 [Patescibacteria group bacterium]
MSNTYQKPTITNCLAPIARMAGFVATACSSGTFVVSYGVCMKTT